MDFEEFRALLQKGNSVPCTLECRHNGGLYTAEIFPYGKYIRFNSPERNELAYKQDIPIPEELLDKVLEHFRETPDMESIAMITYSGFTGEYSLVFPEVKGVSAVHVDYSFPNLGPGQYLVMTIHSHDQMHPFFSSIDNADEWFTGLFGVAGFIGTDKEKIIFRAGSDSCFCSLSKSRIFGKKRV